MSRRRTRSRMSRRNVRRSSDTPLLELADGQTVAGGRRARDTRCRDVVGLGAVCGGSPGQAREHLPGEQGGDEARAAVRAGLSAAGWEDHRMSERKIHLARAIYPRRRYAQTSTANSGGTTVLHAGGSRMIGGRRYIGGPSPVELVSHTSGSALVLDMSPPRPDEIVGYRPVCGAPDKMGVRPRRRSDGINCKRCLRTHAYRKHERRGVTPGDVT